MFDFNENRVKISELTSGQITGKITTKKKNLYIHTFYYIFHNSSVLVSG